MKKINIKLIFLFILALFLGGCYDGNPSFSILTKVNSDGSCERTLVVKDIESKNLTSENLPISIDSSWNMTFQIDSVQIKDGDDLKMKIDTTYFFYKKFESVELLNEDYADTGNFYSPINRSIEFRKKFRWFYTYYEYSETFGNLLSGEPMSNYLTEEELYALISDSDTLPLFEGLDSIEIKNKKDSIDENYGTWISKTYFNAYFEALQNQLNASEVLISYKEPLDSYKDTLYKEFAGKFDYDDLYDLADSLLHANGKIRLLRENKDSLMTSVYDKMELWEYWFFADPFDQRLIIPGELSYANADSIKGDTLLYTFRFQRFLTENYEMRAESRIINKWAFYVSGAIILLALITLIVGRKSKKK